LYSNSHPQDAVTERLRAYADDWRDIRRLTDDELIELIRADRIDILVDLSGHTALNRLAVFARRAAPVQVSYLGYPASTGLATMDYRITDAVTDPPVPMIGIASACCVCPIRNGAFGRSELQRCRVRCPPVRPVSSHSAVSTT
jgi:hypothetical protein